MKKLVELRKRVVDIGVPDVLLQYEEVLLMKNFRQHLETILMSLKVLRMWMQKTSYQKTYELQTRSQEFIVDFKGCERQFD